jgi:RNA-binding protein
MPLNVKQRQALKGQAHALKPIVLLGEKGLTDAVLAEINSALETHELIKVKIGGGEKEEKQAVIDEICEFLRCEFVQLIGGIVILYRKSLNKDKKKK